MTGHPVVPLRTHLLFFLHRRPPILDRPDSLQIKLRLAIKRINSVFLLIHIRELRVAVAKHIGIIEQHAT